MELCSAFPKAIAITARAGLNPVVPTVINDYSCLNLYKKALMGLRRAIIYIDCGREEVKRRETARGDRLKGTSLDLLDRFETASKHDFKVDSTDTLPRELAMQILRRLSIETNLSN